jgi:hypothetical protein
MTNRRSFRKRKTKVVSESESEDDTEKQQNSETYRSYDYNSLTYKDVKCFTDKLETWELEFDDNSKLIISMFRLLTILILHT